MGREFKVSGADTQRAIDLYNSGLSLAQVGDVLGASSSAVNRKLKSCGVVMRPDSCRRTKVNEDFFEVIDTPEKAYWLGFLATDGNVHGTRICINIIDKEHLVKFANALGVPEPDIRTHYRKTKEGDAHKRAIYSIFRFQFRSKKMAADLSAQGVGPNKSFTIMPWNGPEELQKYYWRGCIDGDGGISTDKRTGRRHLMFCGNQQMVEGFQAFVNKFATTSAKTAPLKRIFAFRLGMEASAILLKVLYDGEGPSLDRKQMLATTVDSEIASTYVDRRTLKGRRGYGTSKAPASLATSSQVPGTGPAPSSTPNKRHKQR